MIIKDISVTPNGVQIITGTNDDNGKLQSYEVGSGLWPFLLERAEQIFKELDEIKGKRLVRVDIQGWEAQWSFK